MLALCILPLLVLRIQARMGAEPTAELSVRLYHQLQSEGTQNIVFSPVSVALALGLVELGARGSSLKEIRQAVGYSHLKPGSALLSPFLFTTLYLHLAFRIRSKVSIMLF